MRTYWDGKKQGYDEVIASLDKMSRVLQNDIKFFMSEEGYGVKLKHAEIMQKTVLILKKQILDKKARIQ